MIKKSKSEAKFYEIKHLPIEINDSPRYEYRGIMLDTSRHFLKVDTIKNVITTMADAKFNVFHWHLVDDDSFPLELDSFPSLS